MYVVGSLFVCTRLLLCHVFCLFALTLAKIEFGILSCANNKCVRRHTSTLHSAHNMKYLCEKYFLPRLLATLTESSWCLFAAAITNRLSLCRYAVAKRSKFKHMAWMCGVRASYGSRQTSEPEHSHVRSAASFNMVSILTHAIWHVIESILSHTRSQLSNARLFHAYMCGKSRLLCRIDTKRLWQAFEGLRFAGCLPNERI